MTPRVLALLARAGTGADRRRAGVTAAATAAVGALLLAAVRVLRLPPGGAGEDGPDPRLDQGLAAYVTEAGLRPGVVVAVVLLAVPLLALCVQALRVGSLGRDRAMAALRLAGATPGEVRWVAAAQTAAAGAAGGVLAGPLYLLTWVALGVVPPRGWRLLPPPAALDVLVWPAVVVLLALAGAAAGAAVQARVVTDPLGVHRRTRSPVRGRLSLVLLAAGAILVGVALASALVVSDQWLDVVLLPLVVGGFLLLAFGAGPLVVRTRGQAMVRRGDPVRLLAGARLAADPAAGGRVAGVLVLCGVVLGVAAVFVTSLFTDPVGVTDLGFYVGGAATAAAGVLVAAVVAVLTVSVGAVDQLLDARRPLASLSALGTDPAVLAAVLRRQLSAVTGVPVAVGVVLGGLGLGVPWGVLATGDPGFLVAVLAATAVTAVGAAVALAGAATLAARLLAPTLREATDPDNLRVAG